MDYVYLVKGGEFPTLSLEMWEPFPLKIIRGEEEQLFYKRASPASIGGMILSDHKP
jgi:hypothetical protein